MQKLGEHNLGNYTLNDQQKPTNGSFYPTNGRFLVSFLRQHLVSPTRRHARIQGGEALTALGSKRAYCQGAAPSILRQGVSTRLTRVARTLAIKGGRSRRYARDAPFGEWPPLQVECLRTRSLPKVSLQTRLAAVPQGQRSQRLWRNPLGL